MQIHNITGNHLNDASLSDPVSGGESIGINVYGLTEMHFTSQWNDDTFVNLAQDSEWVGGFNNTPGDVTRVGGYGWFLNNGSSFVNGTAVIGVPVVGTGTFTAVEAHSSGRLEFASSVGGGQTVDIIAGGYGLEHGTLQIDAPHAFHAQVNLGFGEVILEGIRATSYSLKNDLLTLFSGGRVVDTLRFDVVSMGAIAPGPLGVTQVGSAINIHTDFNNAGTALAHHA